MTLPYTQTRWSLDDLFTAQDSPQMQAAFDNLDAQVAAFEDNREKLSSEMSTDEMMEVVRQLEAIMHLAYRIYGYASLSFSADTQDQAAQSFMGRVEQTITHIQNRTLFFSL